MLTENETSTSDNTGEKVEIKMHPWKQLRKKRGFTIRFVEEQTGVSNSYLSQLENGKIKNPSFSVVEKLSNFYFSHLEKSANICCPLCMGEEIEDIRPGVSNWLLIEIFKCKKCGVLFQPIKNI